MKALVYAKPGVKVIDIPEPQLQNPDDVRIKMAYSSVCGSDLHIAAGEYDLPEGFPMGHEGAGTVVELGPEAKTKGLKVGDKVTFYFNKYCGKCHYCRNGKENFCTDVKMVVGAMSEYFVVSEQQVYLLDSNANLAEAALIEPISVCMHGLDLCKIKSGTSVAISGGGGIGQITMQLAKLAGASNVTMIEPITWKRDIALENGADYVIDPINEDVCARVAEITDGYMFDAVIECSGAAAAVKTAYDITGRGGTLEYLATYRSGVNMESIDMVSAFNKEATIISGVYQSPYVLERSAKIYKRLNLSPLIQNVYSLADGEKAFENQRNGKSLKSLYRL